MKLHVTIDGHRNGEHVEVKLSSDEDQLVFEIPNVGRASACTVSVPRSGLIEATSFLKPDLGPLRDAAGPITGAKTANL